VAGRKKLSETERKPEVELARSIAINLKRWRKERGYSQEKLADRADLHRTEVGLLENSKREPKFGIILKLAGALEIEVGELFKGAAFVPGDARRGHFVYDEAGPDSN
jgi:transcriptional regulator with XRE-family HTH domain